MNLTNRTLKTPWGIELEAYGRDNTNDTDTLISCIEQDEYEVGRLPEGGIAIDLGGHIGASALPLLSRGYFVHIVEMLPENVEIIESNLALNNYLDKAKVYEAAIFGKAKEVTAYYANTATEAGQVHEFIGTVLKNKTPAGALSGGVGIKVPTITLEKIFAEGKIEVCDFLKIDIEGAEWEVINNTPPEILSRIKRIAVEIEGLGRIVTSDDFLKLLPEGFKDVSKEYFPKWSKPGHILHGYYINKSL